jgi:CRISPR-associated protein Cas2
MYVLIVYDINVDRVAKVHKILKGFLHWRQNSVFEGFLSDAQLEDVKQRLKKIVDNQEDSVLIYCARDSKWLTCVAIGREDTTSENML